MYLLEGLVVWAQSTPTSLMSHLCLNNRVLHEAQRKKVKSFSLGSLPIEKCLTGAFWWGRAICRNSRKLDDSEAILAPCRFKSFSMVSPKRGKQYYDSRENLQVWVIGVGAQNVPPPNRPYEISSSAFFGVRISLNSSLHFPGITHLGFSRFLRFTK